MKRCSGCGQTKPLDAFARDNANPDGLAYRCRECNSARYRASLTTWRHDWQLQRNYGISAAEYQALHNAQGGVCAICGKPETRRGRGGGIKRLAVDHNHRTGEVRGLLCGDCNRALGYQHDNAEVAQRMAAYLVERPG